MFIVPDHFGKTLMGRDLLAQDYMLKQLTASLMHPEDELGKDFWNRVHKKALEQFGTTEIPMNTFNKIWIVPEKAVIYEHEKGAFVVESKLKVLLEEDYLAMDFHQKSTAKSRDPARDLDMEKNLSLRANEMSEAISENKIASSPAAPRNDVQTQALREVLIPEITKEVNEGKIFANLRQIYHSMILASWYKQNLKESLLGQVYVNQHKTAGVDIEDTSVNQQIYDQYVKAFEKGVFNFIKEDYVAIDFQQKSTATPYAPAEGERLSKKPIPRRYFAGGIGFATTGSPIALATEKNAAVRREVERIGDNTVGVDVDLAAQSASPIRAKFVENGDFLLDIETLPEVIMKNPEFLLHKDTKIRAFGHEDDLPDVTAIRDAWNNHLLAIEAKNDTLGFTMYMAIQDLLKIESADDRVNGKFMGVGGLRKLHYAQGLSLVESLDRGFPTSIDAGEKEAFADALPLASAMELKNRMFIPIGSGKTAVHIHRFDPYDNNLADRAKRDAISRELMRIYNAINRTMGGGLFVAEDQNMTERDMKVMFETIPDPKKNNPWVLPNSDTDHNAHPTHYTAVGVIKGMLAGIKYVAAFKRRHHGLRGKKVLVQGIGNLGQDLIKQLVLEEKALVVAVDKKDLNEVFVGETKQKFIEVDWVKKAIADRQLYLFQETGQDMYNPFRNKVYRSALAKMGILKDTGGIDIFSPNGEPYVITEETVQLLKEAGVKMVAGSTNNPLYSLQQADELHRAGILYIVDWVINSAGVQAVAGTLKFVTGDLREIDLATITDNTKNTVIEVLERWRRDRRREPHLTPLDAALRINEARAKLLPQSVRKAASPIDLAAPSATGGIDFNPSMLTMEIKTNGKNIQFPVPQQPMGNFNVDGFAPVIIRVSPITNLPLLIGLNQS